MKIVAIIQARMASTRLPGKVLLDLEGEAMLVRDLNRLFRAKLLDDVVVATTTISIDDAIADLCQQHNWSYFRGNEIDLLDRYYYAAQKYAADIVVRITADCPLIEPEIVDRVVQEFLDHQSDIDYASNIVPKRTYPRGLDTEVIPFATLDRAWRECDNPSRREHVTPYIYLQPEKFRLHNVTNSVNYSHMRWTVDTPDDLAFVRCIYKHFGHDRFSWHDVLQILVAHPEWLEINRDVLQKAI